jgi:hypothetical protein
LRSVRKTPLCIEIKLRPLMTVWMEIHHYDNLFFVYSLPFFLFFFERISHNS